MAKAARADDKRLEIVKLAFSRFYEGGFHATGIDAVMAESGISKRTLYKYFSSKEELIEAVLGYYYETGIVREIINPAMATSDSPRQQVVAFFDLCKARVDRAPARGCLGVRASQEYNGKNDLISMLGKNIVLNIEKNFIEICGRAGFLEPEEVGRQINILFQGALLLSQVLRESSTFVSAKATALSLFETALVAGRPQQESAIRVQ